MGSVIDIHGKKFGRLTVLSYEGTNNDHKALWKCVCDCGNECIVTGKDLRNGRIKSCGCFRKEVTRKQSLKHGDTIGGKRSRLHSIWHGMLSRCYNPNHVRYSSYGERGIHVYDMWHSYPNFKEWALQSGYADGLSIERLDVNGNYSPDNCTWIPLQDQALNKRNSVKYLGYCESQWANKLGVTRSALEMYRLRHNNSLEKAVRYFTLKNFI